MRGISLGWADLYRPHSSNPTSPSTRIPTLTTTSHRTLVRLAQPTAHPRRQPLPAPSTEGRDGATAWQMTPSTHLSIPAHPVDDSNDSNDANARELLAPASGGEGGHSAHGKWSDGGSTPCTRHSSPPHRRRSRPSPAALPRRSPAAPPPLSARCPPRRPPPPSLSPPAEQRGPGSRAPTRRPPPARPQ